MIERETRLRVARGFGKDETKSSIEVFEKLKRRGHPEGPPPTISDGWGGIDDAMVTVYGKVPCYCGRGRRPIKKRAQQGWKYLQMIKLRDKHGNFLGTKIKVIFGEKEDVKRLLGSSTAYVERTHLTMRNFNSRLVRKGLGFSKNLMMHKCAAAWEDLYYNMVRPLKSLRVKIDSDPSKKWRLRTPAIAAKLTDHIWSIRELLTTIPCTNTG